MKSLRQHRDPAIRVRLPRAGMLPRLFHGQVVDGRTLEPLPGARAALAEPLDLLGRLAPPHPARGRTGLADGEGRFELPAPADGPFWLLVHHPRYLPEVVAVRGGTREARVTLRRPGAIHGRLLDGRGRPLPGVRVRALCPEAVDAADAVTGLDGAFRMEQVRPGRWLVAPDGPAAPALAAAVVEVADGASALALLRPRSAGATEPC